MLFYQELIKLCQQGIQEATDKKEKQLLQKMYLDSFTGYIKKGGTASPVVENGKLVMRIMVAEQPYDCEVEELKESLLQYEQIKTEEPVILQGEELENFILGYQTKEPSLSASVLKENVSNVTHEENKTPLPLPSPLIIEESIIDKREEEAPIRINVIPDTKSILENYPNEPIKKEPITEEIPNVIEKEELVYRSAVPKSFFIETDCESAVIYVTWQVPIKHILFTVKSPEGIITISPDTMTETEAVYVLKEPAIGKWELTPNCYLDNFDIEIKDMVLRSNIRFQKHLTIMDLYSLVITDPNTEEVATQAKLKIVPLFYRDEEPNTDIMVYVEHDNIRRVFSSECDGRSSINIMLGQHGIIVRGKWQNGEFSTQIHATALTKKDNFVINENKKEIRPLVTLPSRIGHGVFYYQEEGFPLVKIHAIPLITSNRQNNATPIMACVEVMNQNDISKRDIYITQDLDTLYIELPENKSLELKGYWNKNTFCCDTIN